MVPDGHCVHPKSDAEKIYSSFIHHSSAEEGKKSTTARVQPQKAPFQVVSIWWWMLVREKREKKNRYSYTTSTQIESRLIIR